MAKYWFRQKRFGYGATPTTWQGWLLIAIGTMLVIGIILFDRTNPDKDWLNPLLILVVLVPFVMLSWIKTEGGWRWRWGDEDRR